MKPFSKPFKHWVQPGFLARCMVSQINEQWPVDGWRVEDGKAQLKWHQPAVSGAAGRLMAYLQGQVFCRHLSDLTGIQGLYSDLDQFGGGLHCIPPGGFLGVHTDFQYLPDGARRRLNLLVYLNETWQAEWGGDLELHGDGVKHIAPVGGTAVLFETTKKTWHGHPKPTTAPVQRRSLAVYYYTPDSGTHDKTVYK